MKTLKLNSKRSNTKGGMTLIELIIAMAITLIMIAAMSGTFYPLIKIFHGQQTQANIKDIANQVITVLKEEVRDARSIMITDSVQTDMVCYYSLDGKIEVDDPLNIGLGNIMPSGLYDDYGVDLKFTPAHSISNALNIELRFININNGAEINTYSGSASTLDPSVNINGTDNGYLCIKK